MKQVSSATASKPQKSKFTTEDDILLTRLVLTSSVVDWSLIASKMHNRNARQCRERWQNYLDPKLVQNEWTEYEDALIIQKQKELGPRWNAIARFFNGRSGNSVRNRYLMIMRHQEKKAKLQKQEQEKIITFPIEEEVKPIIAQNIIMPQPVIPEPPVAHEEAKVETTPEDILEKSINDLFSVDQSSKLFGDDFEFLSNFMY